MSFYAYIHCKPDGTPFYVGKGSDIRARKVERNHNRRHTNTVKKYGKENILVGRLECSTEESAFDLERGLIKRIRKMGIDIVKLTNGGEGSSGLVRPPETRAKMSLAQLGNKKALGVVRSTETRAKMAAAKIGNQWNVGRVYSDETRLKKSRSLGGFPVECEKDGKILQFFSIAEAARKLSLDIGNIVNSLKRRESGKDSRVKGWAFKRLKDVC